MADPAALAKGWSASANAWVASMGEHGDWTRQKVLDPVMLSRALGIDGRFLDIGCGEGRFVRMLQERGMEGAGLDITPELIVQAKAKDPGGTYYVGSGEKLDFADGIFDLAISYLALIDIADYRAAIAEMARIIKPGGHILVANLTSHFTAGKWRRDMLGQAKDFAIDNYAEERSTREQWQGIDIINHHRPLSLYMQCFLDHGLLLEFFDEPLPKDDGTEKARRYTRVLGFMVMQWKKPA
jgi:ubiquinone/menaquinone biosynthesis C-methylase UbiE